MELENFILEEYDQTNPYHKTVIVEINNDKFGAIYLGDLEYQIENIKRRKETKFDLANKAYIAFYNSLPIGYISITHKEDYEISYGICPKFQGYHLGALLLQEFSEKVFEEFTKIEELSLMINNTNTSSKKTATLAGYDKVNSTKYIQTRK